MFDLREVIERALAEDIGPGDVTTLACVEAGVEASGTFCTRQPMVLAGVEILEILYEGETSLALVARTGERLVSGSIIATVRGSARTLLTRERVALNFLQRLSGIATLAAQYVDAVAGTGTKILDTRKTTPGLRRLEKAAAAAGGVINHRIGLYDAILIKNNHIAAAGGVLPALERVCGSNLRVEIEVRTRTEMEEALASGAKHLLLDNLTPAEAREWIAHIAGRATVELSGNITLDNIRAYAEAGPDFISSGAITHSAPAVDINFRLELG
ncbi:MAG: carboxylating nicotinate-nucleotide diphosphorylase [Acidobacteriia bacterium]|nr:carboxylating nicotinate-nucleotide diphosphorylase [Terriglobia bacterium]